MGLVIWQHRAKFVKSMALDSYRAKELAARISRNLSRAVAFYLNVRSGSPARTADPIITNDVLYQLS